MLLTIPSNGLTVTHVAAQPHVAEPHLLAKSMLFEDLYGLALLLATPLMIKAKAERLNLSLT